MSGRLTTSPWNSRILDYENPPNSGSRFAVEPKTPKVGVVGIRLRLPTPSFCSFLRWAFFPFPYSEVLAPSNVGPRPVAGKWIMGTSPGELSGVPLLPVSLEIRRAFDSLSLQRRSLTPPRGVKTTSIFLTVVWLV